MNAWERARYMAHKKLWLPYTVKEFKPYLERTLVIIDMQSFFLDDDDDDDHDSVISSVCSLIQHARQEKWAIIVVEYSGSGETVEAITETLKDYPNQETVIKNDCDGGSKIMECLNSNKIWSNDLVVCGVYGDQCVSQTVAGLFNSSNLVEVDVVLDAIYPPYMSSSEPDEHNQQQEREVQMDDIYVSVRERNSI